MNVVAWARVSSREQREGYSLDAQIRAIRERADKCGYTVVKECVVAESAKRGAERAAFNDMLKWVKANARRQRIAAIISHKLDRACRNMRDAVRLQELEDQCGVQLIFVENQFGPGAAGALSFNVMAAVAQYYSDNLRSEVIKGMDEKVRQGWPTGSAPFGYMNVDDRDEPVQPHPERGPTLIRIFELYSSGTYTFKMLAEQLAREGHLYRPSQPRFTRTALSYILNNRFYVGELLRNGAVFEGRYRRLIDRVTFDECQQVMKGRNRRTGKPLVPLSGGLLTCAYCGQSITGERIKRRLRNGGVNEHVYYRCANNRPGPDHPKVRWRAIDLERAIEDDLSGLRMPSDELAEWFCDALRAAISDVSDHARRQGATLKKRQSEIATMQDRLLTAYLGGTVDEAAYKSKADELGTEQRAIAESLNKMRQAEPAGVDTALSVFDFTQRAAEIWQGSNNTVRRDILDAVCLNRMLSDVTLVTTKRKPFDALAERPVLMESRGDRI